MATVLPDSGDTGNPENHENASDINWNGDAIVFSTKLFDGQENKDERDRIGGIAETTHDKFMDCLKGATTVAKPSDNEKESKSNHENGNDLTPKTTGEFVFGRYFPFRFG